MWVSSRSGGGRIFRLLCRICVYFLWNQLLQVATPSAIVWRGLGCKGKHAEQFSVQVDPDAGVMPDRETSLVIMSDPKNWVKSENNGIQVSILEQR
jgi:hypothetical protein